MPLIRQRRFEKKEPFRDATILIIVCEGEKREPEYFRYFDGLSSRIKLFIVPSIDGKSAPNHLITNAQESLNLLNGEGGDYELWFALDVDRWRDHLHMINNECSNKNGLWKVALSNPCFEVWLYYHFRDMKPIPELLELKNVWKALVNTVVDGGFNCIRHPVHIGDAIQNSKKNYSFIGYLPNPGSTNMHMLAEKIYAPCKDQIDRLLHK